MYLVTTRVDLSFLKRLNHKEFERVQAYLKEVKNERELFAKEHPLTQEEKELSKSNPILAIKNLHNRLNISVSDAKLLIDMHKAS